MGLGDNAWDTKAGAREGWQTDENISARHGRVVEHQIMESNTI